jgi:dTDP-3,4-didehydro-2,6-dideoxy-alpha-D-glucose 3-reductase
MRVLILGLSNIAQRRVVPALKALGTVESIDVATRQARGATQPEWPHGDLYDDYGTALGASDAQVVYVSLVNSEHGQWAEKALRYGKHVVVDKPAFRSLEEAEHMAELADQEGVCLSEAVVVGYHPQLAFLREQFAAAGTAPTRVSATLSFPPMAPGNFRYRRALGGGALWDLGPYAACVGRLLFGAEPDEVHARVLTRGGPDNVDTAFTMMATYPEGRSVTGQFGFETVYANRVDAIGPEVGVTMERFFTSVPDAGNEARISGNQGVTTVTGPAGDAFGAYFGHVLDCIAKRSWAGLAADLLADARTLDRLRRAAGED